MSDNTNIAEEPDNKPRTSPADQESTSIEPRALLSNWANENDEWLRLLVSEVVVTGRPVTEEVVENAYQLLRQEKGLDERELAVVPMLDTEVHRDESIPALKLTRLSDVCGVNALVSGEVIEPHEGLTILYGENGVGKTGYSRIFKALANSRTADRILGNVNTSANDVQSAVVGFKLGEENRTIDWDGARGIPPFTRMSIFDSPAVHTHVDEDLGYVYTPASIVLFEYLSTAIRAVSSKIDAAISNLSSESSELLTRFQQGSSIYARISSLNTSTDLDDLKSKMKIGDTVQDELESLTQHIAELRANATGPRIAVLKSHLPVLTQSLSVANSLLTFELDDYNETLLNYDRLSKDYEIFRGETFVITDLPAEPDDTWHEFIRAGEKYRTHLVDVDAHDSDRCLYCRQPLDRSAKDLLGRYSTYLKNKISSDKQVSESKIAGYITRVNAIEHSHIASFVESHDDAMNGDRPSFFEHIEQIESVRKTIADRIVSKKPLASDVSDLLTTSRREIENALVDVKSSIDTLEDRQVNRNRLLREKETELLELQDAIELGKSWTRIETYVNCTKEIDILTNIKHSMKSLSRNITDLAKIASDQLINHSFDMMFREECEALRAPALKVRFVGQKGKAQRRKTLGDRHKPSEVLSEGEQKVLALADFLAEARLAKSSAPMIFDDPVSSLDHRRVKEVAERIARLADDNQVIVFTHDILFTTTLLSMFEKSKRCAYYQITDESGKGRVTRSTGPRWDTLKGIRGKINDTIRAAEQVEGDQRDALIRAGYSWLRSWCEVFTETELLQGVTQRYQPNVGMTRLSKIKTDRLVDIIPKITEIFDICCRYIDGHSQPLPTLGVSPSLTSLKRHWQELQELKTFHEHM